MEKEYEKAIEHTIAIQKLSKKMPDLTQLGKSKIEDQRKKIEKQFTEEYMTRILEGKYKDEDLEKKIKEAIKEEIEKAQKKEKEKLSKEKKNIIREQVRKSKIAEKAEELAAKTSEETIREIIRFTDIKRT